MSEAKHTDGPWGLDKWGCVVDVTGEQIRVYGVVLTSGAIAKANTRLIAAAPEMLAALIEAEDYLQSWADLGGKTAYRMVIAAIAKATEAS